MRSKRRQLGGQVLLKGEQVKWRDSILCEYFYERNFETTPTVVCLRTATAKLIKYPGHEEWTELFDLKADPYELKNLVKDPSAKGLLSEMQAKFEVKAKALKYTIPENADSPGDSGDAPPKKKSGKKKKAAPEQ